MNRVGGGCAANGWCNHRRSCGENGNGRIAREIADTALTRGDVNITDWLHWFLGCLDRAIGGADQPIGTVLNKSRLWQRINLRPVNERQRLVINGMLKGFEGFLSTSKYPKLAKCSTDTALRDVRELLRRVILVQNSSGGRSTSYRLGDPDDVRD